MNKIKTLFKKLKADDKLVVSLVLIAVAIGLCIIFRNQINQMMTQMFASMKTTIDSLWAGSANPGVIPTT